MKISRSSLACLFIVLGSLISIRFSMGDESLRIIGYIRGNPESTIGVRLFFKGISVLSFGFAGLGAGMLGSFLAHKKQEK